MIGKCWHCEGDHDTSECAGRMSRARTAPKPEFEQFEHDMIRGTEVRELRARAESAEARVREIERAFRNLVARIDGDGGQAQEGGTVAGSLERADTKVVTLQARVKELESELSEARLDLERWHTSVEAHRLATILEQRDEARAEAKALESEVARLREEAGREQAVKAALGWRFATLTTMVYTTKGGPRIVAEWESKDPESNGSEAEAETLPALLRAILEVEKGGPDEG
jgi:hypothetical protein